VTNDSLDEVHEDIASPEATEPPREARVATRSALTRWVAARNLKNQPAAGTPSYERCNERGCWGKASWTCPNCTRKSCSAHRSEHHCSLPYLPR
jgi:hypothetical protein